MNLKIVTTTGTPKPPGPKPHLHEQLTTSMSLGSMRAKEYINLDEFTNYLSSLSLSYQINSAFISFIITYFNNRTSAFANILAFQSNHLITLKLNTKPPNMSANLILAVPARHLTWKVKDDTTSTIARSPPRPRSPYPTAKLVHFKFSDVSELSLEPETTDDDDSADAASFGHDDYDDDSSSELEDSNDEIEFGGSGDEVEGSGDEDSDATSLNSRRSTLNLDDEIRFQVQIMEDVNLLEGVEEEFFKTRAEEVVRSKATEQGEDDSNRK